MNHAAVHTGVTTSLTPPSLPRTSNTATIKKILTATPHPKPARQLAPCTPLA